MPLHCWCFLLGLACVALGASIAFAPAPLSRSLNALPRHGAAGYALSAIAWLWAAYALWNMGLDVLEPFKILIPFLTIVCIPLTWFWLDNLLPCRAIGGLLCLFPYELLHAVRVHPSPLRLIVVTFAYICIVKGMILLLYPWKMRQFIVWLTQRLTLFRLAGGLCACVGLVFIGLGVTVLR